MYSITRFSLAALLLSFAAGASLAQEPTAPAPAPAPAATSPAATPAAATSITPSAKPRPKIGVALEGGGALGLAHIGVLRWFEEHHIPIDYLAGTSMGGLVGGLYSTGKSSSELTNLVQHADWPLLLSGNTPYEDLSFRRKEDARDVPNNIQIGLKHGASLPPGLNSGHQISLLIDRETLPYSGVTSFNDLPIPFRCVSTELVSGKPYVFQDGSLSQAMRATMSIPGVFDPVRRGNMVFVDGGLVDNLPTDVVRKMGAEVVIGIHLQISKTSAKELQSAFAVLGRSVELVIAETELRGMENSDIVVKAEVQEFTTMDYDKTNPLIQKGYEAAEQKSKILLNYALDDAAWAAYMQEKNSRKRSYIGKPQFILVEGVDLQAQRDISGFLQPLVGVPVKSEDVDAYLTRLTGIGKYDNASYAIVQRDGKDGLLITVQPKSYAPPVILPSFSVNGAEPQDVTFTLGARLLAMDVWGDRSEWRTDFEFGETYGIQTQLYRPLDHNSRWFFEPFAGGYQTTFNIYEKQNPRAVYRLDQALGGVNFGYTFNRFNQFYVGYGVGYTDATLRIGQPEFTSFSGRIGVTQFQYIRDHTNEPVIPTNGYYVKTNFNWYDTNPGATEAFPSLNLEVAAYHPFTAKGSGFFTGRGGSTFGYGSTGIPQFFLGGPGRLSSYGLNELFGDQYFFGRVGYLYKVFSLPPFVGKNAYVYGAGEIAKMYGDPTAPRLSGDGAAGFVIETLFGPVLIGGSVGDTGHHKWFFQLGRVF